MNGWGGIDSILLMIFSLFCLICMACLGVALGFISPGYDNDDSGS